MLHVGIMAICDQKLQFLDGLAVESAVTKAIACCFALWGNLHGLFLVTRPVAVMFAGQPGEAPKA
jgi:hypothetical protein